jgi:hypothetical protein
MVWRTLLAIALFASLPHFIKAQIKSSATGVVLLPQGPVTRIPSPNRQWTLIFECPDYSKMRKLWIVDNSSQAKKLVKDYDRSLAIAWAPDGRRFFVDDAYGSSGSGSYVIDATTLKITDLAVIIANNVADSTQFFNSGHSYFQAERWISSHELLVVLFGHFDETHPSRLPRSFSIKYRVDLNGSAMTISQRSVEEP